MTSAGWPVSAPQRSSRLLIMTVLTALALASGCAGPLKQWGGRDLAGLAGAGLRDGPA